MGRLSAIEDNLNRGIYDGQADDDISWLLSEYHRLNTRPTILSVRSSAEAAIALREATPGQPANGSYPATVDEVADELAEFISELDTTCARGLRKALVERLNSAAST
jgi:hypothetical protein